MSESARPQGMTWVLPIREGRGRALRAELEQRRESVLLRLEALSGLHQARLEVLAHPEGTPGLLIETIFDGNLEDHLREFYLAAEEALRAFGLECSTGHGFENARAFVELARARSLRAQAFYVAFALGAHSAPKAHGLPWRALLRERLAEILPALALVPWFEFNEWLRPSSRNGSIEEEAVDSFADIPFQLRGRQTPFTAILALRQGWGRKESLRCALSFVDALLDRDLGFDEAGGLSALQNARFVMLSGEELLVTGVCDGSLDFFFDRLAETIHPLLSAVFMHTEGFPRTRALVFGGARRDTGYRRWRGAFRAPAGIWYSAHPELSASEIRRRARDTRPTQARRSSPRALG